jgi:hypothetical protein
MNGNGESVMIVAKAATSKDPDKNLLLVTEYPQNGVTYIPNLVYGAGSNLGNAVVLYNGPARPTGVQQAIEISGLLPNTDYYVYAFAYNGERGAECYNIGAATKNPAFLSMLRNYDDDIAFGPNNDFQTSATVGTNAPITGIVFPAGDIDCFNFMVTSAAPNVRVLLENLADNYTLELYDFTGRRIRRSTLNGRVNEALVVNDLPAGTYVVRVFAEDPNSLWEKPGDEYKLLINTFSNEIFSVTPKPSMD